VPKIHFRLGFFNTETEQKKPTSDEHRMDTKLTNLAILQGIRTTRAEQEVQALLRKARTDLVTKLERSRIQPVSGGEPGQILRMATSTTTGVLTPEWGYMKYIRLVGSDANVYVLSVEGGVLKCKLDA
jgi:hypothetical protein